MLLEMISGFLLKKRIEHIANFLSTIRKSEERNWDRKKTRETCWLPLFSPSARHQI